MTKIKVGDRFSTNEGCTVVVTNYDSANRVTVKFEGYNYSACVRSDSLRKGTVRNPMLPSVYGVGFSGVGDYRVKSEGKHTKQYTAWREMLKRCYSSTLHNRRPSYVSCEACPEWHDYQVFAEWFDRQLQSGCADIHLDKDILKHGNKLYSPDTCTLIPGDINSLLIDCKAARGNHPVGVFWNKQLRKYQSSCRVGGMKRFHIGLFSCPKEAHEAYREFKEAHVKRVAQKYKGIIDPRAYDALMCYKVVCPVYEAMI